MLEVNFVSKYYHVIDREVKALNEISFKMERPEILGIMGKSGSGKTTLLKIIAGLISPSSGTVKLNNEVISKPTRKIGMVFQDYTAFPWLTIEKNIEFGLKVNKVPLSSIKTIVKQMLDATDLSDHRTMYPNTLSGGQKQRLAIARALAVEPEVLLMDEPFGALDEETKDQMHDFIKSIWEKMPFKLIFVTHNKVEAKKVCQRIIYLK
jgi:NitT/TauT family transport system ATP-binding protein